MPFILQYLFKLSISLGIVFLFYHFILRRLTFYSHNRWYLLGYPALSFVISLVDVSSVFKADDSFNERIIFFMPSVHFIDPLPSLNTSNQFNPWQLIVAIVILGTITMIIRLVLQLVSVQRIKKNAKLIAHDPIRFYQVDKDIMPFSFGNSIYLNQQLHSEEEFKKIIRHEFVHVKQHHTVDILFTELLCIINWFNPFAWMIRKAVRQNLEFIADNKVVQAGIDKKQYQYLLLKVIGNTQFSIANKFNFSSLKKRIAMMNRMKSTKIHLVKFLFILPLIACMLLAFRSQQTIQSGKIDHLQIMMDTVPAKNSIWPPAPSQSEKDFLGRHPNVSKITWGYLSLTSDASMGNTGDAVLNLQLKNGSSDTYLLGKDESVNKFKATYGEAPPVPAAKPELIEEPLDARGRAVIRLKGSAGDSGKEPLYIVDGVEMKEGEMNKLNPNSIESIDVLKNAESQKIYGPRAENGVLIIKTRKSLTLVADSIAFKGDSRQLKLMGNASMKTQDGMTISSDTIVLEETHEKNPELKEVTVVGYQTKKNPELKEVTVVGYPAKTNAELKEVTVVGYPTKKTSEVKEVTVVGYPTKKTSEVKEVTVVGYPTKKTSEVKEVTVVGYPTKKTSEVKEVTVVGYPTKKTSEVKEVTVVGYQTKKNPELKEVTVAGYLKKTSDSTKVKEVIVTGRPTKQ